MALESDLKSRFLIAALALKISRCGLEIHDMKIFSDLTQDIFLPVSRCQTRGL